MNNSRTPTYILAASNPGKEKVVYMDRENSIQARIKNNINSSVIFSSNVKKTPSIVQKYEYLPMKRSSLFGKMSPTQNIRY